jgi:VWFA-related protein
MKKISTTCLSIALLLSLVAAQTPPQPRPQQPQTGADEILRITTELVQTDVVVTDKNDQLVTDLKLDDFEVYENGRKQEISFMELVSVDSPQRPGDSSLTAKVAPGVDAAIARDLSAKDLKRVIAFVVDDVTIPSEDMSRVRQMLLDFVDNKMQEGDLVAIVRTVGGKGLLEQFTTDRQILRRAIAQLGVRSIPPYLAFGGLEGDRVTSTPQPLGEAIGVSLDDRTGDQTIGSNTEFEGPSEGTNQVPRAVLALSVSNALVDSLRQVAGRKNLILLSGGLPLFDLSRGGNVVSDVGQLFRVLTDNATRSGVVINTMDVRGLKVSGAVGSFQDTPARSGLASTLGEAASGNNETPGFGRGIDSARLGDRSPTEQLSLRTLATTTGGVSVVNSNNFSAGLDKVLSRSRAYYRLAYRPSEKFDKKFHRVEIKVRRTGARVYAAEGYFAREPTAAGLRTKEEEIIAAARSPLARRDLEVAAELQYKFSPTNQAQLDINAFIDAHKLNFTRTTDGKYQTSMDVVGFVFDQLGRNRGGISQTVKADLSEEDYQRALATGISYTASTELPPGYYQVRLVVREITMGNTGTVSRYFEVPDLTNKQLTMSSLLLYAVNPNGGNKSAPEQLSAARTISRKQDLRYAGIVYNARLESGKPRLRVRLIISQGNKMLFQEPEQAFESPGAPGQFVKLGQIGLARVPVGRYVLTLVITDPLADKKRQIVTRSVDFTVVN